MLKKRFFKIILLYGITFLLSTGLSSAVYSGQKWSGTSTSYYINSTFAASFVTAINAADTTWDGAGSKFRFNYAGTSSRNPNVWSSSYKLDTYNDIGYYNYGSTGVIVAASGGGLSGSTITERDVTLNTYYSHTTVGASGSYDVQNTMTHELGHWLKLLDVSGVLSPTWCGFSFEATMCGSTTAGETRKRSLGTDDINLIKATYGI